MVRTFSHINSLQATLGGAISLLGDEVLWQLSSLGESAETVYIPMDKNMIYIRCQFDLKNTFGYTLPQEKSWLCFLYCSKGGINYSLGTDLENQYHIGCHQTAIMGSNAKNLNLHIQEQELVEFTIIYVLNRQNHEDGINDINPISNRLFEVFLPNDDSGVFTYQGTVNLRIREQLEQIKNLKQTGIIRNFMIRGMIYFALSLELLHHQEDTSKKEWAATHLTKRELIQIQESIEKIEQNPQKRWSVVGLSRECGLNSGKMQAGFRVLTGSTISHFIRNQRLKWAEKLIRDANFNISEVVYQVGFTSRSYFSKIFKQKYGQSPKLYQEQCKQLHSS